MAQRTGLIVLLAMIATKYGAIATRASSAIGLRVSQFSRCDSFRRRGIGGAKWLSLPFGVRAQPEKPRSVPFSAGDLKDDFGQAGKGPAVIGETILQDRYPVAPTFPGSHKFGTWLDLTGQFEAALRFGRHCFDQSVEHLPDLSGKAAVGLLLDFLRDTAPKQIRPKCLGRLRPKQLLVSAP